MTQAAKSQEPSMEEILASIRRIIADDDASKTAARTAEPKAEVKVEPRPEPKLEVPPAPRPQIAPEPQPFSSVAAPREEADHSLTQELPPASDDLEPADILDLTESMAAPVPSPNYSDGAMHAAQFRTIDAHADVAFADPAEAAAPPVMPPAEEPGRLISSATSAAVDSAFNALAQTVLVQNARTLEDLVREMLRPMLKTWLDDNLPNMVERLVRAEIERVSRGRAA